MRPRNRRRVDRTEPPQARTTERAARPWAVVDKAGNREAAALHAM
ncbi:hypothetical protein ACFXPN_03075 [Streptomyces griseorubiginosus]